MAYFKAGQEKYNNLSQLVLIGGTQDESWKKCDFISWRKKDFLPYVAHLDNEGKADDWFFDSFALWHFKSPSGGFLYSDINIGTTRSGEGDFYAVPVPNPGNKKDWEEIVEWYFKPEIFINALEKAIIQAQEQIGSKKSSKHNIIITIPYPGPLQTQFGKIDGKNLNFSIKGQNLEKATKDRLKACKWFVDLVIEKFDELNSKYLNLLGFYWTFETLHRSWDIDDHWLLKELHKYINKKNKIITWIPFYSTYNIHLLDDYQKYYFDIAFLQPNYMFYDNIKDVDRAAIAAKERNAGIEMEFYTANDETIMERDKRLKKFDKYLQGGVKYGYMKESACAWFDGGKAIYKLYYHGDEKESKYYEKIYRFIKGTYKG